MAYSVSYSGSSMDTILAKGLTFEDKNEAWVIIPSSITTLDISKVRHKGNYVYTGTLSLPSMDQLYGFKNTTTQAATTINCTCMIFVRYINHVIYQFISMHGIQDTDDQMIGIAWINNTPKVFYLSEETNTMMAIIDNESSDKGIHKFDKQIRVFKDTKTIKYYDIISASYKPFILDMMPKSIYGNVENFFSYIDTNITNRYAFFTTHMEDSSVHMSNTEKTSFDDKYRSDLVDSDIISLRDKFFAELNTQISNVKSTITAIQNKISDYATSLNNHANNTTLHPTQAQIDEWNSKANSVHTHTEDEITIDASNVTGTFTIDQIPDQAKERMTVVDSTTTMLTLTKDTVKIGDWVFVQDADYPLLFVVIDDTKLNSLDGYQQMIENPPELIWDNVQNKPTTYAQLGIEDDMDNSDVDSLVTSLNSEISNAQTVVDDITTKISVYSVDRVKSTHNLETSIDIADQKLSVLYNVTSIPEKIVSTLEQVLV